MDLIPYSLFCSIGSNSIFANVSLPCLMKLYSKTWRDVNPKFVWVSAKCFDNCIVLNTYMCIHIYLCVYAYVWTLASFYRNVYEDFGISLTHTGKTRGHNEQVYDRQTRSTSLAMLFIYNCQLEILKCQDFKCLVKLGQEPSDFLKINFIWVPISIYLLLEGTEKGCSKWRYVLPCRDCLSLLCRNIVPENYTSHTFKISPIHMQKQLL